MEREIGKRTQRETEERERKIEKMEEKNRRIEGNARRRGQNNDDKNE